jgi:CRP-like cAMP-binding protein
MKDQYINFIPSAHELNAFYEHIKTSGANPTLEDLALILPCVRQKSFKKGECLLKVGEISQDVYFNTKGIARSYFQLPNGVEKTYFIITEHTIFSDYASLISQTPATENIEAIEDIEVYCIGYEDLMSLYKEHHCWETFGRNIGDFNFTFSQKRLRSMMNDDAATKYTKFMKHYESLAHRIPQHIIASYLGITPQSLSRLKKEMIVL